MALERIENLMITTKEDSTNDSEKIRDGNEICDWACSDCVSNKKFQRKKKWGEGFSVTRCNEFQGNSKQQIIHFIFNKEYKRSSGLKTSFIYYSKRFSTMGIINTKKHREQLLISKHY